MDDATGAYLLIGVVTRSFLMLLSFFCFGSVSQGLMG
jgi:hypothetical protein